MFNRSVFEQGAQDHDDEKIIGTREELCICVKGARKTKSSPSRPERRNKTPRCLVGNRKKCKESGRRRSTTSTPQRILNQLLYDPFILSCRLILPKLDSEAGVAGVPGSSDNWFLSCMIQSCCNNSADELLTDGSRSKHFLKKSKPSSESCSLEGSCGGLP